MVITPITHKIYEISATGSYEDASVNQIRVEAIAKNIQDKYGFKIDPLDDFPNSKILKSSDGQYSISVHYDNQINEAQLQLDCMYVPLLHLSMAESETLRQKAIKDTAKNSPIL